MIVLKLIMCIPAFILFGILGMYLWDEHRELTGFVLITMLIIFISNISKWGLTL